MSHDVTIPGRLLIVDDEPRIRSFVSRGLEAEGLDVDVAASGPEAVRLTAERRYDLVILDLLLPEVDGFKTLGVLLDQRPDQGVMVLSCLDTPETKVACLDLGAADYLAKPFSFDELLARVRARLRDRGHPPPYAVALPAELGDRSTVRAGRATLDLLRREVNVGKGPVLLADREFLLLRELLDHSGQAISKQRLLSTVWGYHFDPGSNVVDVCVWRLRSKLGHDMIRTVRGKGYAFNAS